MTVTSYHLSSLEIRTAFVDPLCDLVREKKQLVHAELCHLRGIMGEHRGAETVESHSHSDAVASLTAFSLEPHTKCSILLRV